MATFYYIKTERGQSLYDIAVQEYGNAQGVWWILTDNEALCTHGLCTIMPAGLDLKIRTEKPVSSDVQKYFRDKNIIVNTNVDDNLIITPETPVIGSLELLELTYVVENDKNITVGFVIKNNYSVFKTATISIQLVSGSAPQEIVFAIAPGATTERYTKTYENLQHGVYDFVVTGDVAGILHNIVIPGRLEPGVDDIIIVAPDETATINIATDAAEAIFINYFLKEVPTDTELQTERYVGKIRIINDTDTATATLTGNEYDNTNGTWLNTALAAGTAEGYITLSITAPVDKTVYFKRHVVTVL